ncbi:DUF6207 family protein [Streptomyces sp. NPDC001480]|uniref:DUF6207 family protein n=1 Tax=Streptomyces sp. NPDC001480 TaxID=3364577 RepID=UPI00369C1BD7
MGTTANLPPPHLPQSRSRGEGYVDDVLPRRASMKPIRDGHVAEPGFVVVDAAAADDDTGS